MAFIITSKTKRSQSWRSGKKAEVDTQLSDVTRRNNEKAADFTDRQVRRAIDKHGDWDG